MLVGSFCFFKQKAAYELRISDWSSDVCSSDLQGASVLVTDIGARAAGQVAEAIGGQGRARAATLDVGDAASIELAVASIVGWTGRLDVVVHAAGMWAGGTVLDIDEARSEEHTSELQSLMRISYAVFCLKKKK